MNKEEYKTIINLLNENKIDELRKYLDNRMNSKYVSQVQKTLLKLINSDCDRQYPSYYQRTQLHEGVKKYYRGFYTKVDNGFIICHGNGTAFQLYDRSILSSEIIDILERSYYYYFDEEERKKHSQRLINIFSDLNEKNVKKISSINENKTNVIASTSDEQKIIISTEYYKIAHKLLGEDVLEYISGNAMYFNSPNGKALVCRMNNKKVF